jgi:hypothetical protein
MSGKTKRFLWAGAVGLLILATGVTLWIRRFHNYTPAAVLRDLGAAARAEHAPRPVDRYLELRYGPMTEPANRQRAFLEFFDMDHIEALYLIVGFMAGDQKRTNIAAMAQWIVEYRQTMSPQEKAALGKYLSSEPGRATLQRATAQYLQKDVKFRSETAAVIQELMTTLATTQR